MIDRSLNYGRHHIRNFLASSSYKSVLDVGAGTGADLQIAAEVSPSATQFAVEFNPDAVRGLESRGANVMQIDIERDRFPLADESVDFIIANQVIEHTKDLYWIFHEITRVLPIGGRIIIGVPNLASLHNRLLLALGKQPTSIKTASAHVRGFTKADLLHFFESVFSGGYSLEGFGGSNFYPFPGYLAQPLASMFPTMAWGIFLMLEKRRAYTDEFLQYPGEQRLETNFYVG